MEQHYELFDVGGTTVKIRVHDQLTEDWEEQDQTERYFDERDRVHDAYLSNQEFFRTDPNAK